MAYKSLGATTALQIQREYKVLEETKEIQVDRVRADRRPQEGRSEATGGGRSEVTGGQIRGHWRADQRPLGGRSEATGHQKEFT